MKTFSKLAISTLLLAQLAGAPKAHAQAPSYYTMSAIPCFFMMSGMMTPVCAATMGTMWMMNASMSMGPMAVLSVPHKMQTNRAIEFKKHLQELALMGAINKEDVESISTEILKKMGKNGCVFDLTALENDRLTDAEKVIAIALKNNISPETAKYLSGIQGINLAE